MHHFRFSLLLVVSLLSSLVIAQDFSSFQFRELGPYRGGRVTAVAGVADKPATFYLGATGGGIWKTEDYGSTWNNVSDGFFTTPSIGAIAVAQQDPNIIYVGTGSDGLRSNVIEGDGMYKSIDGGKNWTKIGLEKAGQIGAVKIHPANHNIVYVAAIGNAFKSNAERGIFKTSDGGKSWEKVLYVSDKVGFADVELMPSNPEIVYASAWKAERKPWTIISGGTTAEGGVYKSLDGGKSWEKITSGLPQKLIGKIDLEVTPADSRIVYALVEAPDEEGGLYKSIDQGETFEQVSDERIIRTRPFYYTNVRVDPNDADVVYVLATRYSKSTDGGKNWKTISSPHGDNHDMWINPNNSDLFIQANDGGANVTHNGGKSWSTQYNQPTAELYQIEVDDQHPYWVYAGQQDNYTTIAVPTMAPYAIQAAGTGYIMNTGGCETGPAVPKPGDPNTVYSNCKGRFTVFDKVTGIEKSYYVGAANMYGQNPRDLKYRFQRVSPIHVSPHDPNIVYHCSQFVHKTTDEGESWETISPDLTAFEADKQVISGAPITRDITGEEFYSTIYSIRESPLKAGLIWVGANDGPIHITQDGGKNWTDVTPDKSLNGGRVDAIHASNHQEGKAYASILRYQLGDPKPYIYKTENYGKSWTLISNGIPAHHSVRVVREDPVKEGLLFAGTEFGLYISMDDGNSWKSFQQNLPVTPITDLKIHRDDLVMSTMGRGFWILDNISVLRQEAFNNSTQHHLYKPKDTYRYQYPLGARGAATPNYPRPVVYIDYQLGADLNADLQLEILDEQDNRIAAFTNSKDDELTEELTIENMRLSRAEYVVNRSLKTKKGIHRFKWDMRHTGPWHPNKNRAFQGGPAAKPGKYKVKLTIGDKTQIENFELLQDPRSLDIVGSADFDELLGLHLKVRDLLSEARMKIRDLEKEQKELTQSSIMDDGKKARLELIDSQLKILQTQEGTYMPPMLASQISYLYNMLRSGNQRPGKDAYDRYEELSKKMESIQ